MDPELHRRRREIEKARESFSASTPSGVGSDVMGSWVRCARLLDLPVDRAPVESSPDTAARWDASPIRRSAPHVVDRLEQVARNAELIGIITDSAGRILWQSTPPGLRRGADRVGLVFGGQWDETSAGTNGIGVALATGAPATVFATEHWSAPVRDWVCYSAPVRAPDGATVGIIDLSTQWERDNPLGLQTVSLLASLAETALLGDSTNRLGGASLELNVLGRPRVLLHGRPVSLSRRQLEILTILAFVGAATLDELHAYTYGDHPVSPTTLKAEISHLRQALGGAIGSRPYRLTVECDVDALDVVELLDRGNTSAAATRYRGQLLAFSDAPLIVERRYHIDVAMRAALLLNGSTADVLQFTKVHPGDIELLDRAIAAAAPSDPTLAAAVASRAVGELS